MSENSTCKTCRHALWWMCIKCGDLIPPEYIVCSKEELENIKRRIGARQHYEDWKKREGKCR